MSKPQCDAAMKHILLEVFDLDEDSPVHQALNYHGIDSLQAMCSLEIYEIYKLTYSVDEGSHTTLPSGYIGLLRSFKGFIAHQATIGKEIKDDDWASISPDDFDRYRTSLAFFTYQKSMSSQGTKLSSNKCATKSAKLETMSSQAIGSPLTFMAMKDHTSTPTPVQ